MKKTYEKPEIKILQLTNQDIIMYSINITDGEDDVNWDVFDIY